MDELVLVVDSDVIDEFTGLRKSSFTTDNEDIEKFSQILRGSYFMDRNEAEKQPMFKQIIPYLVITSTVMSKLRVLTYKRAGSEKRLNDLYSIGIGGHINPVDSCERKMGLVHNAIKREVQEELEYTGSDFWENFGEDFIARGVLYDDSNDVGKVHLGLVLQINISEDVAKCLKMRDGGKDLSWKTITELKKLDSLENWSLICFEHSIPF